jgi:hypothetical protein
MPKFALLFVVMTAVLIRGALATTTMPLSDSEKAFVTSASSSLGQRYPTAATAKSGGYSPLEGAMDSDKTYNWTDFTFTDVTPDHPNFLWYDRNGNLVGVDWELPKSQYPAAPHLAAYPVQAARWVTIPEHVHFAYTSGGKTSYGVAKASAALRQSHITLQQLRASGAKLPADATLVWAMYHPAVWDLAMWVVPNPNGPFAEMNPNVK